MLFEVWGMNHRSAPLEIREKAAHQGKNLENELRELSSGGSNIESVILLTCNRFEIYTLHDEDIAFRAVPVFIERRYGFSNEEISRYFYHFTGEDAFRHLLRVVTSLDSMVIGDAQILGQVRKAFFVSENGSFAGPSLRRIFHKAFDTGRKARRETGIGKGSVSVSSLSIAHVSRLLGALENRNVMVIGAGKTGESTIKHLLEMGVKDITVSNRTFTKACELARQASLRAVRFEDMFTAMRAADLVITSTGAPDYIIRKQDIAGVMRNRPERELVLIDIAVPRDIDPAAASLANVHLCNIDDLDKIRQKNMRERLREASIVELIINDSIAAAGRLDFFSERFYERENSGRHEGQPARFGAI